MIFAETSRLRLRALEKRDLRRCAELIGDWDVVRWLVHVPYPYALRDAQDWLVKVEAGYRAAKPAFFLIADKESDEMMGAVGMDIPRVPEPEPGERALGYWLGKPYWAKGFMSEAVKAVLKLAFARTEIAVVTATTDPANRASQRVLYKAGLYYLGIHPRLEKALRGGPEETCWALPRAAFERNGASA